MTTDIIIPVINEEKVLSEKKDYFQNLKKKTRIIFVDGGSKDRTVEIAKNFGDVVPSQCGRSIQMNLGAKHSGSENLLFLHVDTYIREEAIDQIGSVLENGFSGGCFTMNIEDGSFIFRIFENIVNLRAKRFGVIDGDLGVFVKKSTFDSLGQFDNLPIMEDILFSKKLRKKGKINVLPLKINVSARRWKQDGFINTITKYTLAYIQLWTKIPFYKFQ